MPDKSSNSARIAKNTLMLYVRMLVLMAISLYTSRMVLSVLGVEDYGIYNVVGGVVTMFGFLNVALSSGTQRFLNYELGRGNDGQLQKVFMTAISVHALIAFIVVILAETVGLWFVYNKMTIPDARMNAAFWVYQFSILSTVVLMLSAPYNAAIIAHERMSAFAYISILEAVLKLLIVFLLSVGNLDRLIFYAFLMFATQLTIRFVYGSYCKKHFPETKFRMMWDKRLFRSMLSFVTWNTFGSLSGVASTQGVNILLNMFFTPAVNAARGISVQVQNAVMQFSHNFQTAMNPQIVKSYAADDLKNMHGLIHWGSKFTFFLLYTLSLPIFIETDAILNIWLTTVPEYTVPFLRLLLCTSIVNAVANPLMMSAAATGRIKVYQAVVGGLQLTVLLFAYVALKLGGDPVSVFVVNLSIYVIAFIARLLMVRPMIHLSIRAYINNVILRCAYVCVLPLIPAMLLKYFMKEDLLSFFVICIVCVLSVVVTSYFIGFTDSERSFIKKWLTSFISKLKGNKTK